MINDLNEPEKAKTRFLDCTSRRESYVGLHYFYTKKQLRTGEPGQIIPNTEYWWSEHEGMTFEPKPWRCPVYRTDIMRPHKDGH